MQTLGTDYTQNTELLDTLLRIQESFDLIARRLHVADRQASLYFVDGFAKDEILEKILEYILKLQKEDMQPYHTAQTFAARYIPYIEVDLENDVHKLITQILSGAIVLLLEGYTEAILIDARTYPTRSIQEPEDDRVLRGSRDGFVETMIFNTALIRRRIRDPRLTMQYFQVGSVSRTDITLCYLDGVVKDKVLRRMQEKLRSITIKTLTLGQESLAECLLRGQWYNPFPKIRYTERPDSACAALAEGRMILVVDNSPTVMIVPTAVFDFVQDTNDYYFPPLVGTYLRFVRGLVFLLTLLLTPVWFLLIQHPDMLPAWLSFLQVKEPNTVPILLQLMIVEIMVDAIKLASLNTPSSLSNAFSIVGALILGEFAVKAELFVPEVLLYMAFVAIATFTQPSFELGYAFKLFRILFLILTALWDWWGFFAGVLVMLIVLVTTRTVGGSSYLYPLIPFRGKALLRLILRRPISRDNT